MGARVPGRAVPWGLGRLPWVPGARPRGSQGGGPGPKLQGPITVTLTHGPFDFASKFMSILVSIFGRFGVDVGSLLGVIFGHVGAFFGPSWSQNRLRTVLSSKTLKFTKPFKTNCFRRFFTQDGAPKRPKIPPRRVQDRLGSLFFRLEFLL